MTDLFTLTQVFQRGAEVGVANYIRHTQPSSDRLKMREAYRWLATMGVRPCVLNELIANGVITQERLGKAKNSPVCVSRSEIMAALAAKDLGQLLFNK